MLQSPVVTSSIKKAALLEVFKNSNKLTGNLIDTLITNKRIIILGYCSQNIMILDELKEQKLQQLLQQYH